MLLKSNRIYSTTRKLISLVERKIENVCLFSKFHLKLLDCFEKCEIVKAEYPINSNFNLEELQRFASDVFKLEASISPLTRGNYVKCVSDKKERKCFDLVNATVKQLKGQFDQCVRELNFDRIISEYKSTIQVPARSKTGCWCVE